ncbi:hypothetical protein Q0590_08395 [Rhodocytophaga aerolata]|uniref:Uncharacterized protein n=1 Tax=Rhodocytophaga aerolata TaxID=455078 RepID=A0ABT8R2F1_9BACT|nr:hypothetical protein [Rhodocytophaga aerolata]MDO1446268.1 hypothetical protein [Rhodocytophaga aerolata]
MSTQTQLPLLKARLESFSLDETYIDFCQKCKADTEFKPFQMQAIDTRAFARLACLTCNTPIRCVFEDQNITIYSPLTF